VQDELFSIGPYPLHGAVWHMAQLYSLKAIGTFSYACYLGDILFASAIV
jgi:hypothetical protein